jgi:hypothetical protein
MLTIDDAIVIIDSSQEDLKRSPGETRKTHGMLYITTKTDQHLGIWTDRVEKYDGVRVKVQQYKWNIADIVTIKCTNNNGFGTKKDSKIKNGVGECLLLKTEAALRELITKLNLQNQAVIPAPSSISPSDPKDEKGKIDNIFESEVEKSSKDSSKNRLDRISKAPKIPAKLVVATTMYQRNPDVVAEVLFRANGICDICMQPAPFERRKDGTPYLVLLC